MTEKEQPEESVFPDLSDEPDDTFSMKWQRWALDKLSEPFPEKYIERTKGRETYKKYDTTGYKYIVEVQRVNHVLGLGGWSFSFKDVSKVEGKTSKGKPTVDIVLECQIFLLNYEGEIWCSRSGVGGHVSGNEADARKGAQTNALKKTLALIGVGWEAYAGTIDDDNVPLPEGHDSPYQKGRTVAKQGMADVKKRLIQAEKTMGNQLFAQVKRQWDGKDEDELLKMLVDTYKKKQEQPKEEWKIPDHMLEDDEQALDADFPYGDDEPGADG